MNIILEMLVQYDTNIYLKYVWRSVTYISLSSDFALYLEDYLMDNCHSWDIGSRWCKGLPHWMYVGQWSTFHSSVILSSIMKTIGGLMLYWRYWFSVTQKLAWNYICMAYISWSSDFALYLEDCLMDICHNLNIESMWCKDFPHKMYVRQWYIFHGPVIPSYILKTFW